MHKVDDFSVAVAACAMHEVDDFSVTARMCCAACAFILIDKRVVAVASDKRQGPRCEALIRLPSRGHG